MLDVGLSEIGWFYSENRCLKLLSHDGNSVALGLEILLIKSSRCPLEHLEQCDKIRC